MILDIIIIVESLQNPAADIPKLITIIGVHIASNMLSSLIQTPLKTSINLPTLTHREGYQSHVHMNRKSILLALLLVSVSLHKPDQILLLIDLECNHTRIESE